MSALAASVTIGNTICDWIETYLVLATAENRGDPFLLDDDEVRFVQTVYELRPDGSRRWPHAAYLRPKGAGKTELASALAAAELLAPVEFDGFDARGEPVGRPRRDPQVVCSAVDGVVSSE